MRKIQGLLVACLTVHGWLVCAGAKLSPDEQFENLTDTYLEGHLAWRPTVGMALGLHQYDGRLTDFSRASLDAELKRIRAFEAKLAALDAKKLSPEHSFDYRLLQSTLRTEVFWFEGAQTYTRNPM